MNLHFFQLIIPSSRYKNSHKYKVVQCSSAFDVNWSLWHCALILVVHALDVGVHIECIGCIFWKHNMDQVVTMGISELCICHWVRFYFFHVGMYLFIRVLLFLYLVCCFFVALFGASPFKKFVQLHYQWKRRIVLKWSSFRCTCGCHSSVIRAFVWTKLNCSFTTKYFA